jgi:hypothetical protein
MTKAEQITQLHRAGKSPREIALEIYGDDYPFLKTAIGYVRFALRHKGRHESAEEYAWRTFQRWRQVFNDSDAKAKRRRSVTQSKSPGSASGQRRPMSVGVGRRSRTGLVRNPTRFQ